MMNRTAVFVHGVPETSRVWDKLRSELRDIESVALSLPGFGAPLPEGFTATMDEYADWLVRELEQQTESPVDLVGHDWGGLLTARLVSIRPELVRSWTSDAVGPLDPEWKWHEFARTWQTPGDGERSMAAARSLPRDQRAERFVAMGIPREDALDLLSRQNEQMDDCVLKLYRSAVDVGTKWGADLGHVPAPGLVLLPTDDPFGGAEDLIRRVARRAGARIERLEDVGHWWPYQDPLRVAGILRGFWSSVPDEPL